MLNDGLCGYSGSLLSFLLNILVAAAHLFGLPLLVSISFSQRDAVHCVISDIFFFFFATLRNAVDLIASGSIRLWRITISRGNLLQADCRINWVAYRSKFVQVLIRRKNNWRDIIVKFSITSFKAGSIVISWIFKCSCASAWCICVLFVWNCNSRPIERKQWVKKNWMSKWLFYWWKEDSIVVILLSLFFFLVIRIFSFYDPFPIFY